MFQNLVKNNEWLTENLNQEIDWRGIKRFASYLHPFRRKVLATFLLSVLLSAPAFVVPPVFGRIQHALGERHAWELVTALLAYLGLYIFQNGMRYLFGRIRADIYTALSRNVLLRYYRKLLNTSVKDFLAFRKNTNLFQRVMDARKVTGQFVDVLVNGTRNVILVVVFGTVIGILAVEVLGVLLVGTVFLVLYTLYTSAHFRRRHQRKLQVNYPLVAKMIEVIEGLLTVKTLTASVDVTSDVSSLVDTHRTADYREQEYRARIDAVTSVLKNVTLISTLAASFWLLWIDQLAVANLFAIYILVRGFLGPMLKITNLYKDLSALSVNLQKYFEVMDLPSEVTKAVLTKGATANGRPLQTTAHGGQDGESPPVPSFKGGVAFRNVHFSYDGSTAVLKGLNLEVKSGEKVALIGRSGAGKTTILRLMLGFIEPQRGQVLVNGHDVSEIENKDAFRSNFGVVSQSDFLFNISLRENILYGLETKHSNQKVTSVLKQVNLWNKIEDLEKGLETPYRDDDFSGGEKQRLLVARALIRNPNIVLLDEPTSAMDFENEQEVFSALDTLVKNKTTLTIAHRLSTVKSADRVLVLNDGCIVETGNHRRLYRDNDYYQALCEHSSFAA